jgi:hypothetical protein
MINSYNLHKLLARKTGGVRWWRTIIVLETLMVIAALVSCYWPGSVEVPQVAGLTISEAGGKIAEHGLKVGDTLREESSDIKSDIVIRSEPEYGQLVTHGTQINLIVSDGPPPIELPNLAGKTTTEAQQWLESACTPYPCLNVKVRRELNAETKPDYILRTEPAAGTKARPGSQITLIASAGGCTPVLVSPEDGATLDNGRSDNYDTIVWDFNWSGCPGVRWYYVLISGPSITIRAPTTKTSYREERSGSFAKLDGWSWQVIAEFNEQITRSDTWAFRLEPVNTDPKIITEASQP